MWIIVIQIRDQESLHNTRVPNTREMQQNLSKTTANADTKRRKSDNLLLDADRINYRKLKSLISVFLTCFNVTGV